MKIEPLTENVPPLPDAGLGALATTRGNLPLDAVDIRAEVTGLSAGISMTQGFRNPFDVPLEATYIFPLPDRAAVTAMRMEADGRVVEGVLKERGQAREEYEAALAEGRRAAIAEEERPDVFTMNVGNILPGERVTVRLDLSQPLPYEDGEATLRFPLVVAPRYIPGDPIAGPPAGRGVGPDTDAVPDASRISPPVLLPGFPEPVRLSLTVDIDPAGLPLGEVRSSLHTVTAEGEFAPANPPRPTSRTLRLEPGERLDRDFVLRLGYEAGESCAVSDGTFTLTVVPPDGGAASRPRDVVIAIDRSGSMGGWKMVAARRAAARIVDTLRGRDRFAVLSFDHLIERALPDGLSEATDRNRYRAVEHLARLEARGGTEMLPALLEAVSLLTEERERVLVLVTDGQVANEDQILGRLALDGIRVHAIGIDRAVNAGFLGRLAAAGSGRCELVESEERLDEVMDHVHRRIGSPLVTGVSVDAPTAVPDTITPSRPCDLFPGVPLVVRGRCTAPGAVTVRGVAADGSPWERRLPMTETGTPGTAIWARAMLRELEDRWAAGATDLEERIVETSLRYGVLCRFTAYVAVDSRVVADGTPSHRVVQPVEPPSGWQQAAPFAAPLIAHSGARVPRAAGRPIRGFARVAAPAQPEIDGPAHVADELRRLRAQRPTTEAERRQILADLGSRLHVLLPGELTELVAALRSCDAPDGPRGRSLDELWDRTLRELAAYAGEPRPFWRQRPV